jgi:hypothetical protein
MVGLLSFSSPPVANSQSVHLIIDVISNIWQADEVKFMIIINCFMPDAGHCINMPLWPFLLIFLDKSRGTCRPGEDFADPRSAQACVLQQRTQLGWTFRIFVRISFRVIFAPQLVLTSAFGSTSRSKNVEVSNGKRTS